MRLASRAKLTAIASANGSAIYGITEKGSVSRITPTGDWTFDPPSPARWAFPQPNGTVVIAGNEGSSTVLWLIRPTDDDVIETKSLPLVSRGVRTQVGDRLYFTVDSGLIGVNTRDLSPLKSVRLEHPVVAVVPTPSGDRLYVAVRGSNRISVVDRYTESIAATVDLPAPAIELRMDPYGQSILAKPADGDSAWVIGVGNDRVSGVVRTTWRNDLPAFGPGGTIATVRGADVILVDGRTLSEKSTVSAGAKDFWYFFKWNGFRPRAADLDRPVTFDTVRRAPPTDSTGAMPGKDSMPVPPVRDTKPWMIEPPANLPTRAGYMVSFAAVLSEAKADEIAAGIVVNGSRPRVLATQSDGTTLYRVALGPFASREEAERVGRDSRRQYWVYEETR